MRALAGEFVTHTLLVTIILRKTRDFGTLVYPCAQAFLPVALVFNCFCNFVVTLRALFLERIRAFAGGLVADARLVALTFGFAHHFLSCFGGLAKINFRDTNALTLRSALVRVGVRVFVVAFLANIPYFNRTFAICRLAFARGSTSVCGRTFDA